MAQDFERDILTGIGTIPDDIPSGADFNSDDTIIGINMANTSANAITASCFMTSSVLSYGSDFNFAVTVSGSNFLIDGQTKPAITIYKGFTYTFDLSSNTISSGSHVFALATEANGANSSGYTTNVVTSGTQGQAGATLTLTTTSTTPTTLYYYCTAHTGMGNTITSSNVHYIIKDAPIPSGSSLQLLDGGAKMVVQNGDRMFFQSSTASSLDVWVSRVDSIST
jgi:plastocyanin